MANIPLQTIKFPGLSGTYTVPQIDTTLTTSGKAADAKKTGDEISDIKNDLASSLITDTASGAIASFPDGSANAMESVVVNIEPVQSGSGDPSPTNFRPISGWTQVQTTVCGQNLMDNSIFATYGGVLQSDGSYYFANADVVYNKVLWENTKGITGALTCVSKYRYNSSSAVGVRYQIEYTDGTISSIYLTPTTTTTINVTTSDSGKTVSKIFGDYGSKTVETYVNLAVYQTAETEYIPYTGTTHTTSLNQTVYGGTLDVVSGVLTIDKKYVDLSTITFSNNGTYYYSSSILADAEDPNHYNYNGVTPIISDTYMSDTPNNVVHATTNNTIAYYTSALGGLMIVSNSTPTGHIVYPLATPTTVQLTAQEVDSLLGDNNVFADAGDVSVTYKADTKLYIQKVINA